MKKTFQIITCVMGLEETIGTMKEIMESNTYKECIKNDISFSLVEYDPHKLTLDEMREWDIAFTEMGY